MVIRRGWTTGGSLADWCGDFVDVDAGAANEGQTGVNYSETAARAGLRLINAVLATDFPRSAATNWSLLAQADTPQRRSGTPVAGEPRIVVRYERYPENFLGMLHLACSLILLRVFMGLLLIKPSFALSRLPRR